MSRATVGSSWSGWSYRMTMFPARSFHAAAPALRCRRSSPLENGRLDVGSSDGQYLSLREGVIVQRKALGEVGIRRSSSCSLRSTPSGLPAQGPVEREAKSPPPASCDAGPVVACEVACPGRYLTRHTRSHRRPPGVAVTRGEPASASPVRGHGGHFTERICGAGPARLCIGSVSSQQEHPRGVRLLGRLRRGRVPRLRRPA